MGAEPELPVELARKIKALLQYYEETLVPHEPGTPCLLSTVVLMATLCGFYRTLAGVESVCRHCLGCAEHCKCCEDDPDDDC